ncbi:MAG TPA: hypothetical protein VMU99_07675 [Acidimicrobiales bacterium]|nr:hypothetical protein [Acidimicrobiales bacterium]
MGTEPEHLDLLLTPLEQHIVEIVAELSGAIAELAPGGDETLPLAEFDQRLLLEHAQIISRYILAQAAARAYPGRFRLIGHASPSTGRDVEHEHHDGHEHNDGTHQHHVADPASARAAHKSGRAIIGEHPWEHDHEHGDGHGHADEWEWETIDKNEAGT